MKLIITGSRDIDLSVDELDSLLKANFEISSISEVVTGCAKGVDTSGIQWASKYDIPIKRFFPDWSLGRSAGHIRNRQMGDYADQAIVVYNDFKE